MFLLSGLSHFVKLSPIGNAIWVRSGLTWFEESLRWAWVELREITRHAVELMRHSTILHSLQFYWSMLTCCLFWGRSTHKPKHDHGLHIYALEGSVVRLNHDFAHVLWCLLSSELSIFAFRISRFVHSVGLVNIYACYIFKQARASGCQLGDWHFLINYEIHFGLPLWQHRLGECRTWQMVVVNYIKQRD